MNHPVCLTRSTLTERVEHSSGKSRHRRLNRGGNRQANAALYRIVLTRL
ncbi:transposase [Streptomyces sp. NBC_01549]|nr:transposase [Streptomyces sp. NBC_01549]